MTTTLQFMMPKVVLDDQLVDRVVDWSLCRSPSRSKRRHRRGIKTRMRIIAVPRKDIVSIDDGRVLVMHPETYRALEKRLALDMERRKEILAAEALLGRL